MIRFVQSCAIISWDDILTSYFLLCRLLEFEDQVTFSDSIKLIEKCITRKTWSALHIVHNEERIVLCLAGNVGQRALGRHPA